MKLQYRTGNLMDIGQGIIAHGCNCRSIMGGGVALAIRNAFPKAYKEYINAPQRLGTINIVPVGPSLFIANCFTQERFGSKPTVWADLSAIKTTIKACLNIAQTRGLKVYIPRIGCGLGGLNWPTQVAPMLEKLLDEYEEDLLYVIDLPPKNTTGPYQ